jgi:hypothetical protein
MSEKTATIPSTVNDPQVRQPLLPAKVRRVLSGSLTYLVMTTLAVVYLARWLMFRLGGGPVISREADLIRAVARLAVGLPLWLVFWRWAQRLFSGPDEEERSSVLRKV